MKLPVKKAWHSGPYEIDIELRRPTKKEIIASCIGWGLLVSTVAGAVIYKKHASK